MPCLQNTVVILNWIKADSTFLGLFWFDNHSLPKTQNCWEFKQLTVSKDFNHECFARFGVAYLPHDILTAADWGISDTVSYTHLTLPTKA